jgi:hypothetical protein
MNQPGTAPYSISADPAKAILCAIAYTPFDSTTRLQANPHIDRPMRLSYNVSGNARKAMGIPVTPQSINPSMYEGRLSPGRSINSKKEEKKIMISVKTRRPNTCRVVDQGILQVGRES